MPYSNSLKAAQGFQSLHQLVEDLKEHGCRACDLGFQPQINGVCTQRGPLGVRVMFLGEAPGKDEDWKRKPFTGPAGILLDKILASVGLDSNDYYIGNIVKCRPVAEYGSGKQNFTPKAEQIRRCRPYLDRELELLKPNLIVTLGLLATKAIMPEVKTIGSVRGQIFKRQINSREVTIFPMLHPAAILHASADPVKHQLYRNQTWQDIQNLKPLILNS